jgi:anti-sigma factor RsiW
VPEKAFAQRLGEPTEDKEPEDVSQPPDAITEADLHAYVDGRLADDRRAAVEAYLAAHPEVASRIADYLEQNARLHTVFDPVLAEPVPERLLARPRPALRVRPLKPLLARAVLAAACLVLGVGLGWFARGVAIAPERMAQALVREAMSAHTIFASDEHRPVEIDASHEGDLQRWLSKRMGGDVRAPQLASLGYHLLGGRLLASEQGPAALFMYEGPNGERMTLVLVTSLANDTDVPLRDLHRDGVRAVYWLEDNVGCVLVGNAADHDLTAAARTAYRQLIEEPRGAGTSPPT